MRWGDRVVAIVLGMLLGVGIVALFVFVYSERTVDAPSIARADRPRRGRRSAGERSA